MGFLVDPFAETVTDLSERLNAHRNQDDYLDDVRATIGCEQLVIIGLIPGRLAMFIDNFAVLKGMRGQGQRYWRFKDGTEKVAGKAVMVAVDTATGFIAPIRQDLLEQVANNVLWLPDVHPLRIVEIVSAAPGETPVLSYRTIWSDERLDDGAALPDPESLRPAPRIPTRWEISATAAGVKAVRYELRDGEDELRIAEAVTAKDLAELLTLLPAGLTRVEPLDDDPPEILGYWVPAGAPDVAPAEVPA